MGRFKKNIEKIFPKEDIRHLSIISVLENFYDGIIITDKEGRILFINEEQERVDDIFLKDILNKKITEVYHVDDGVSPAMKCLETKKSIKGLACYYRTHTGKMVNSIHNVFPLFSKNRLIGALCLIQDFSIVEQRFDAIFHPQKIIGLQENKNEYNAVKKGMQFANGTRFRFQDIIGSSKEFMDCLNLAKLAAKSTSSVMLFGETGTGKELVAQSIHNISDRNQNQYVAINCAAIPENLLEGLLFGTSKGAFTNAMEKEGLFEKADGGTLFLDEIDSMTIGLQAKLLRVLQERKLRRVGSLREIDIDVKIISSVNQNPHKSISDGNLRADLFYRLAVVLICIPPLRERLTDLDALIRHFLNKTNIMLDKSVQGISDEILDLFKRYPWPGNVREMEHVIESAMHLVVKSNTLKMHHLPFHLSLFFEEQTRIDDDRSRKNIQKNPTFLSEIKTENELSIIRKALEKTHGRPSDAARLIGISPQLMNYKIIKYKINRMEYLPDY